VDLERPGQPRVGAEPERDDAEIDGRPPGELAEVGELLPHDLAATHHPPQGALIDQYRNPRRLRAVEALREAGGPAHPGPDPVGQFPVARIERADPADHLGGVALDLAQTWHEGDLHEMNLDRIGFPLQKFVEGSLPPHLG
jgi:hypothetical protein